MSINRAAVVSCRGLLRVNCSEKVGNTESKEYMLVARTLSPLTIERRMATEVVSMGIGLTVEMDVDVAWKIFGMMVKKIIGVMAETIIGVVAEMIIGVVAETIIGVVAETIISMRAEKNKSLVLEMKVGLVLEMIIGKVLGTFISKVNGLSNSMELGTVWGTGVMLATTLSAGSS